MSAVKPKYESATMTILAEAMPIEYGTADRHIEHSLADEADVQWLVARAAPRDEADLARGDGDGAARRLCANAVAVDGDASAAR